MKKFKRNSLMMLLFGICSLFSIGIVKAEDYFTISGNMTVVCNPEVIGAGEQTKCYIIGNPIVTGDETKASVHGYVSKAFVTKDLEIIGAEHNANIAGTAVAFTDLQTVTGTDKLTGDDIPDEVASVRCTADNNEDWVEQAYTTKKAIKNNRANDWACAMFYTKKGVSKNAYTPSSIRTGSAAYRSNVLKNHSEFGVIGNYIVQMPANATDTGSCGEICVMAKGVQNLADYATWNTSGSKDTVRFDACVEIGRRGSPTVDPGITPETGAFTSYALLVAGALIAIGAVAIAKKNNRFSKI